MKHYWSKKAEKDLDKIYLYAEANFSSELALHIYYKIKATVSQLESFPELGRKIGDHFLKRYLVVDGNIILYEIVLGKAPMVIIRSIRPRKETQ